MPLLTLKDPTLKKLVHISTRLKDISTTIALLSWDQETYITAQGSLARSRQLEILSGIHHQEATKKTIARLLEKAQISIDRKPEDFSSYDRALVKEMTRDYNLATKIPQKLVEALSKESSLGLEAWRHARTQSNFSLYQPNLEHMITLKREVAHCYGFTHSPYDALLNEFEADLDTHEVKRVFDTLKKDIVPLIPTLTEKTLSHAHGLFTKSYDQKKLWDLSMHLLTLIGFDLQRGRQDQSTHPFTVGLNIDDVRLTTRILSDNPISTLLSSIHEGGHGLYEQGISPEIANTTLGLLDSLIIHESQSRFWENMIGKSRAFWKYFFPYMQAAFPEHLSKANDTLAWEEVNVIKPSLIRVDADEVTYHLHIIIRTEIETMLMENNLQAADVPQMWNTLYQQYLGVTVPNDTIGCLQDIHWSQGLIGYFPTYSFGSLYAAQLFGELKLDTPNIDAAIAAGKFEQPLHWLQRKIHASGRLYSVPPISPTAYQHYINDKFTL